MKTPKTLVTKLSSGLTVASHEKYETVVILSKYHILGECYRNFHWFWKYQ